MSGEQAGEFPPAALPAAEREARWAFGLVPQLGGEGLKALLDAFGSAEAAWRAAGHQQLHPLPGVGPAAVTAIVRCRWRRELDEERRRLGETPCRVWVWGDPEYPARLAAIPSPPILLYQRGPLALQDEPAIAVVGSRHATAYGEDMAREFGAELSRRGLTVVSGLARGIDAAAHRGALEAGGRTAAVLGCGLDQVYPPEHRELADGIRASGALVSEFSLGTPPARLNFPRRNRIISGLSLGVVVVEAGVGSGALITAHHALEQGREVFAVPGRVHARYSEGCHRLIKVGAKLVESWEDVLAELLPQVKGRQPRPVRPAGPSPSGLSAEQRQVFELLAAGAQHIDAVIVRTGLPAGRVASALVSLEMRGLVRELTGKVFERHDSA